MPEVSNPVYQPDRKVNAIVDAVVEHITTQIIRPGPKPEERECTTVAKEIADIKPDLYLIAWEAAKNA